MPIGFVVLGAVSLLAARAFLTMSARLAALEPADPALVAETSPAVRGVTAN